MAAKAHPNFTHTESFTVFHVDLLSEVLGGNINATVFTEYFFAIPEFFGCL